MATANNVVVAEHAVDRCGVPIGTRQRGVCSVSLGVIVMELFWLLTRIPTHVSPGLTHDWDRPGE